MNELLCYDEATGLLHWKVSRGRVRAGDLAGTSNGRGYIIVRVDGKIYPAHRIAWFLKTGEWPTGVIDHINRDGEDNRWENLRDVSQQENLFNKGMMESNTSGITGIRFREEYNKWYAFIGIDGKQKHLGSFETKELAEEAYLAAKEYYHQIGTKK